MSEVCKHEQVECPNHEGGFDCHSFCATCEGFQEYCPEGCEKKFDDTLDISE